MTVGRRRWCYYCKRTLAPPQPEIGLSFTRDHVIAEVNGGWRKVPCCRDCNGLKGELPPQDWFWFISAHPRWWKRFKTPQQVVSAVRMERSYRAYSGLKQIGRDWR